MKFFHQTLLGGDQLTAARARGSIAARRDHQTRRERLQGLLPVAEDWHAYLRYIYTEYYSLHTAAVLAHCWYLYYNLLNELNFLLYPCRLFGNTFLLSLPAQRKVQFKVLFLNVVTSVDPEKNMKGCEDFLLIVLHAHVVAAGNKLMEKKQYDTVQDLARAILCKFTNFDPDKKNSQNDRIHLYGTELLTLAIIWHSFDDSI